MPAPAPNNQPFPTWSEILGTIKEPAHQKKYINENAEGYNPFLLENKNVLDYYKEDTKDNIAILYNGKIYLSKRSIIKQQYNEAIVYECLEVVTLKEITRPNVVGNISYYNLKKIGIDISPDDAGILPEYIYLQGIDALLRISGDPKDPPYPYFTVIPGDKILASVISHQEANKIPEDPNAPMIGPSDSALHCQVGQKGLTGFIVKGFMEKKEENPIEEKPHRGKTQCSWREEMEKNNKKTKRTIKKSKKSNKKTKRTIKKSKKYNKN
jgi:hypothetical protein